MKIILLQQVKGVGKKFEVKEVSDGYAKNVLIPKGLAKIATPQEIQKLNEQKATWEKNAAEQKARFLQIKEDLRTKELSFPVKTGSKDEVFGSVGADVIKVALREQGIGVEKINLPKPLKALGRFEVEVILGMGVSAKVAVILLRQ
jgi:large subunit ribosomal protein L9